MTYKQSKYERINQCMVNLLVHSVIYYSYNDSIWSDAKFDAVCKELVSYKDCSQFANQKHFKVFKDFDGHTGFHLCKSATEGHKYIAKWLIDNRVKI